MQTWQIQQAKSHFSEVIDLAITQGAQRVTRRGNEVAVILSLKDYEQINGKNNSLLDTLLNAPKGEDLDIARSRESIRELAL
ncbi:MAG: type II toxin-antitoxin system Phd/YefM family antitoxin [Piscirickettsiaceae bacterium CG_4_9_14_3_um_filter_43_564]|nr:type II toxin-antitoxin system Phd/YefM family antitoxin [Thiomicrospira sp.]OIP95890.1 MAG: prevent-host-death protein [Thiomicrospira sp. CG2_30_44_34]PIW78062.1 MAG: type II toxin-antitoxin system Phd/YefM family antitoxin [Piscirickettsiaceae bacterium CG_4_8_14_3_um_filter_44_38]PIX78635.1 MAG: type II toxin-antitoxin system Phd/YefM family antitoxin [Piscirickettsiaceae bacterium CG_4_10_14_3_um_filter_44_349]PIY76764.1 MAG: type II toxin-antitoxin system Phd/YefM family antitoxin [Pis